ncbi:MAG: hypothetical protein FJX65_17100 [Alphaproteobacteria bacterium]|nr:hypothetical protein [Alphaproteobacteria bacterium]
MSDEQGLRGRDVQRTVAAHHGIDLATPRAEAIATEVRALVEPVRRALSEHPFDTDPFGFSGVLDALKDNP